MSIRAAVPHTGRRPGPAAESGDDPTGSPGVHSVDPSDTHHGDVRGPERVARRDHVLGAVATVAVVAAWAVLAAWRPHVTYHLAPVFAGAAWPVALRRGAPRVAPIDAGVGALVGGAAALLASLVLWWAGLLDGPTLWGDDPAIAETIPAVLLGAVGGCRYTRCGPSS